MLLGQLCVCLVVFGLLHYEENLSKLENHSINNFLIYFSQLLGDISNL